MSLRHKSKRWGNKVVRALSEELGQASVEAMILFAAVLCICVGLFLFFTASSDNSLQEHHLEAASHTLDFNIAEGAQDVLLY